MTHTAVVADRTNSRRTGVEAVPNDVRLRACRAATAEARVRAVRRVIAVMRERYAESLSLGELSEIAISSPFHFSRVFREVTGTGTVSAAGDATGTITVAAKSIDTSVKVSMSRWEPPFCQASSYTRSRSAGSTSRADRVGNAKSLEKGWFRA